MPAIIVFRLASAFSLRPEQLLQFVPHTKVCLIYGAVGRSHLLRDFSRRELGRLQQGHTALQLRYLRKGLLDGQAFLYRRRAILIGTHKRHQALAFLGPDRLQLHL